VHDIGLRMHRNEAGEPGFEVIVGGGLGRTPMIGKTIRRFLPKQHLLSYLEAILRVYNQFGRRDNLYKARIKILVHEIGAEEMARRVEEEWQATRDGMLQLDAETIVAIAAHFAPPDFPLRPQRVPELEALRLEDRDFGRFLRANVSPHRQPGYASVTLSLKPAGEAPGDATTEQMETVADLAERFSFGEIRVSHEQNLVLPHVALADLPKLWPALQAAGLATANAGKVSDIIAWPTPVRSPWPSASAAASRIWRAPTTSAS
jgi:sulfite reductase (NADPH) hemoprotein beta-component